MWADFLKPYLAKEALAAKNERETLFISYKLDKKIVQSKLLKKEHRHEKFEKC